MQIITPFLMFEGNAESAMNFYISLFKDATVINISRYEANETGTEGTVKHATFTLNGQEFICIDSYVSHGFSFTPAMSLYVKCSSDEEINSLFEKISEEGKILMPLDKYPFSEKYGWVSDKFGVSWQLALRKI